VLLLSECLLLLFTSLSTQSGNVWILPRSWKAVGLNDDGKSSSRDTMWSLFLTEKFQATNDKWMGVSIAVGFVT
jgi:hypothetical protein